MELQYILVPLGRHLHHVNTWISRRVCQVCVAAVYPRPSGAAPSPRCYLDIQKCVPGVCSCSISSSLWGGTFTMLLPGYPEGCAGCVELQYILVPLGRHLHHVTTWISRRVCRVCVAAVYPRTSEAAPSPGVWSCSISPSLCGGTFTMLLPGYPEGCAGCVELQYILVPLWRHLHHVVTWISRRVCRVCGAAVYPRPSVAAPSPCWRP